MNFPTKNFPSQSMLSLLLVMGSTLFSGQSIAQTSVVVKDNHQGAHFFEVSYGNTPSGTVTSNSFSAYGLNDLNADVQYDPSPSVNMEYGVRKAWGLPVDVSVSVTQMQTVVTGVNISAMRMSQPLSRHSITNFYSVNAYYDVWSQTNWRLFMGAGLGWANLIDADTQGVSAALTVGTRYNMGSSFYGVLKYKLVTIPESKFRADELQGMSLTLPKQIMPIVSIGIGMDF